MCITRQLQMKGLTKSTGQLSKAYLFSWLPYVFDLINSYGAFKEKSKLVKQNHDYFEQKKKET